MQYVTFKRKFKEIAEQNSTLDKTQNEGQILCQLVGKHKNRITDEQAEHYYRRMTDEGKI